MQHLNQLLNIKNSELAKLLKFSLHGLEATLSQARTELPNDPGAKICDEVLQELHSLLQPQQDISVIIPSSNELKLNHLREAFATDPELNYYLGNSPLQSQIDSDLWNEIHRKLLRVPEDLATDWRQLALELVKEVGAVEDNSHLYQVPFIRDEIIYPGLSGTVSAKGLCLTPDLAGLSQLRGYVCLNKHF